MIVPLIAAATASAEAQPRADISGAVPSSIPPTLPFVPGSRIETDAPFAADLRLRIDVTPPVTADAEGPRGPVRRRVTRPMVDLHPIGLDGFHLSAGAQVRNRHAGDLPRRSAFIPHPDDRIRTRRAPILTMGYTDMIDDATRVGIEVGAVKGAAYRNGRDLMRREPGARGMGSPINPMIHLMLGQRF